MKIQAAIEAKLREGLSPVYLDVVNESHMHSVPPDSETHFRVVLVSPAFAGLRQVPRHQKVYQLLGDELAGEVHALALHTYAPDEWQGEAPDSPACLGGSRRDS